jgi:2-dehydropantoate 2-reductase
VPATTDPAPVAAADLVVLLVKAWATAEAVASVRPYLREEAAVLTLQNGLGNGAALRAALGPEPRPEVLVGVTSQAALRVAPGVVRHTGSGPTLVGREGGGVDARATAAAAAFTAAGLAAAAVPDIDRWVWRKLAVNAAINGLTALAGVPNGEIAADPDLRAAGVALAREVEAVARAHGLELGDVAAAVAEVATATAGNRSSMLRDLETGGRTEVDAIHCAVVAAGDAVGIDTPGNRTVAALVRARERAFARAGGTDSTRCGGDDHN